MERAADAAEEVAEIKTALQEHSYERVGHSALVAVKGCARGVGGGREEVVYEFGVCMPRDMRQSECEETFWRSKRNKM